MPATPTVNPTRAALEAAVLDLTDEQIASALCKVDRAVKTAYEEREAYAWPREAQLSLLTALANPDVKKLLATQGVEPVGGAPDVALGGWHAGG